MGLLMISWLLIQDGLYAQEYLTTYKRIFIKASGPENYINTLANDSKGFLWLGTNNGLFRFDGKDNDAIQLYQDTKKNVQINDLAIDGKILFAATQEGVLQLDLSTYKTIENLQISKIKGEIINMLADKAYGVWWLTKDGLLYHWKNGMLRKIKLEVGERHRNGSLFFFKGNIWVTTQFKGTYIVDGNTMRITQHLLFPSLKTNEWTVRKTDNDELYVISNIGLFQLKQNQTKFELQQLTDGFFTNIISKNNMKFSVVNGNKLVYHYNPANIQKNISIEIGADKPETINKLIFNKDKFFIATTNGFTVLEFKKNLFELVHSTYNKMNNTFEVPRGILETNDEYLLSTYDGIYGYKKDKKQLDQRFKKSDKTYALLKEHDNIWMVTDGAGFKKWDLKKNIISNQPLNNIEDATNFKSIAQLNDQTLILGTYHNLIGYDMKSGVGKVIQIQHKNWEAGRNFIYSIQPRDEGRGTRDEGTAGDPVILREAKELAGDKGTAGSKFYVASSWGVLLVDVEGKVYADFGKGLNNALDKQTYALWISSDKSIWAGTGNGVYHFSESGKILHHLTTKNGLTGERVASITPDKNNHLWVATFTGLSSINLTTLEIKNFTKEEGLPDNEFNHSASLLTSTGEIILGTVNGFIKFSPTQVSQKSSEIPTLHISKIEIGNSNEEEKLLSIAGIKNDTILVDKKFNYVRINLFLDPLDILQKTTYEYKVNGIHAEWIKMGNIPTVHLDNYKKGKYDLQIRAITGQGSSNIITKNFVVIVDEYFYKTPLFYAVLFLTFLLLIFLYFLLYIKRNKKIVEIRQHIAQDLHDEIGSYITGINMNIELMQQKKGREVEQIQTIQTLGQKALMSLRDSLWSLDIKSDNGLQFWDRVKTIASESYGPLEITYNISGIDDMEKIHLTMLEKNYLLYIIKECITNSLKHGDKKQVELRWELINNFHQITVSNGIGEIRSSRKHGQGKYNIETRMKKIGGAVNFIKTDKQYIVELKLNFLK